MGKLGYAGSRLGRFAMAAPLLALLAACQVHDPDHAKSHDDYEALTSRKPPAPAVPEAPPPIPPLQPILAAPPPPGAAQRLVSISVTDPNVPVRDVLVELTRKVGVDLDLDAAVSGGVIITARDRPFEEVLARICDLDKLRYSFKDNVVKVEPDDMYYQIYHLDMLNTARTLTTDLANSLSISTLIQGAGTSGGAGNQSSSEIKGTSNLDAWKDVEDNVKTILANSAPRVAGATSAPASAPVLAPPAAAAPAAAQAGTGGSGPAAQAANYAAQTAAAVGGAGSTAPGSSAPAPAAEPAPAAAPAADAAGQTAHYSVNRQAGILSIYGTSKQQKLIQAYLDKVVAKIGAQVLIEAKVVEIALNDQYNTGVDWQALRKNLKGTSFGVSNMTPNTSPATALPVLGGTPTSPFGTFGINAGFTSFGGDLSAMINLVKVYGDVRTLSSPRLTVMNNQPATLKVAQNHVYFKLQATVTSTPASTGSAASQTATYNSQLQTLPIGLVMTVQPSIDAERGQVTLGLRPSVTAWPGTTVSDPAVALSIASACGSASTGACSPANISNAISAASVPVVDIREMESVVTVPSGAVVVLGGLMQQIDSKNDSGVPGASEVPIVGNLFKANNDQVQLTELVVFLKATLVHGPDSVDWADKDTYKNYMHDPRPLTF